MSIDNPSPFPQSSHPEVENGIDVAKRVREVLYYWSIVKEPEAVELPKFDPSEGRSREDHEAALDYIIDDARGMNSEHTNEMFAAWKAIPFDLHEELLSKFLSDGESGLAERLRIFDADID